MEIKGSVGPNDNSAAVRVLLADGEKLVRAALRELLEGESDIEVAAEAASGQHAIALAARVRPDVVLMNARLPSVDGLEATRRITAHRQLAQVEVLILSYEEERDEHLFDALRAGAKGLLTRDTEPAELLRAVRVLAGGGVRLSPSATRRLIDAFVCRSSGTSPPSRSE